MMVSNLMNMLPIGNMLLALCNLYLLYRNLKSFNNAHLAMDHVDRIRGMYEEYLKQLERELSELQLLEKHYNDALKNMRQHSHKQGK